jgi:hypothetical protein
MDEFVQTHTPLQVTSFVDLNPGGKTNVIGLMVAEEAPAKKEPVNYERPKPATP